MAKKKSPKKSDRDVLAEMESIVRAYPVVGAHLPKTHDVKAATAQHEAFQQQIVDAEVARAAWSKSVAVKTGGRKGTLKFIRRVRKIVAGAYDEDAIELNSVGLTRSSARKKPVRVAKPKAPPAKHGATVNPTDASANQNAESTVAKKAS